MITIDLLIHHRDKISDLARIWRETLGKYWIPDLWLEYIKDLMAAESVQILFHSPLLR